MRSDHLHIVINPCPKETEAQQYRSDHSLDRFILEAKPGSTVAIGRAITPRWYTGCYDCIPVYRKRLSSLSWLIKRLNDPIAHQANQEDGYTGHF